MGSGGAVVASGTPCAGPCARTAPRSRRSAPHGAARLRGGAPLPRVGRPRREILCWVEGEVALPPFTGGGSDASCAASHGSRCAHEARTGSCRRRCGVGPPEPAGPGAGSNGVTTTCASRTWSSATGVSRRSSLRLRGAWDRCWTSRSRSGTGSDPRPGYRPRAARAGQRSASPRSAPSMRSIARRGVPSWVHLGAFLDRAMESCAAGRVGLTPTYGLERGLHGAEPGVRAPADRTRRPSPGSPRPARSPERTAWATLRRP